MARENKRRQKNNTNEDKKLITETKTADNQTAQNVVIEDNFKTKDSNSPKTVKTVKKTYKLSELLKKAQKVFIYNGNTKTLIKVKNLNDKSIILQANNVLILHDVMKTNDKDVIRAEFKDNGIYNAAYMIDYKNGSIYIRNLFAPQYLQSDVEISLIVLSND